MGNGYAHPIGGIYHVDLQNMVVMIKFEGCKLVLLFPIDPLGNYAPSETKRGTNLSDIKRIQRLLYFKDQELIMLSKDLLEEEMLVRFDMN